VGRTTGQDGHVAVTAVSHNKMKEFEQWGLLLGTVSVSSIHRMALTTLHGRRQQKTEPHTRFRGLMKCVRGGRVDRGGSPLLNWMPLDWLQEDLSTPTGIRSRRGWGLSWGPCWPITGFGSARVEGRGRQSVTGRRVKQSGWFVRNTAVHVTLTNRLFF
jgi:hypothetical protein